MGLSTSHDAWRGAYSAFNRWRNTVARAAGYDTGMVKYENGHERETILIDWGHITEKNLAGKWDETPADPLIVLIAHSDCDGKIYPKQAVPLADRLEELLPLLPQDRDGGHIGDWRKTTQRFIDGLRKAAANREAVDFY
jgi:hypothetical protein